jgi:ketosteroid isomerase-like protein
MSALRMLAVFILCFIHPLAHADEAGEVGAAVAQLYAHLSQGNAKGFATYLPEQGFGEINPEWQGVRQLDMRYFNPIFQSGAKIDLTVSNLKVQLLDGAASVALVTGFRHGSITPPGGKPIMLHDPLTMIWQKSAGGWKLVHVHLSPSVAAQ